MSRNAYDTPAEADAAVQRLIAEGISADRISVLSGQPTHDHAEEAVGAFAGDGGPVGSFAGRQGSSADTMGEFAPTNGHQRRGGFGDVDRDQIATYENGVRRVHVASHHELERAGLDAADIAALHEGRVLVLVSAM